MPKDTESPDTVGPLLHPLTGWEAVARWNAATLDWMTKGWQQWLALVTTLPASAAAPEKAARSARATDRPDPLLPAADAGARAMARSDTGRSSPKRPAKARTAKPRTGKPRARG